LTTARSTASFEAAKREAFMPASSSIRWPWPAPRMAPGMKTEALILALSHAALADAAPPAGAHRQHLGHGRAGLLPLRRQRAA
jgi:hypothetical protein